MPIIKNQFFFEELTIEINNNFVSQQFKEDEPSIVQKIFSEKGENLTFDRLKELADCSKNNCEFQESEIQGHLLIYSNGRWSTIYSAYFDDEHEKENVNVACKSMGYKNGKQIKQE